MCSITLFLSCIRSHTLLSHYLCDAVCLAVCHRSKHLTSFVSDQFYKEPSKCMCVFGVASLCLDYLLSAAKIGPADIVQQFQNTKYSCADLLI